MNLPGGILRRRGVQDELMMREYFKEGDLISVSGETVIVCVCGGGVWVGG